MKKIIYLFSTFVFGFLGVLFFTFLIPTEPCACIKLSGVVEHKLDYAACQIRTIETTCNLYVNNFNNVAQIRNSLSNCNVEFKECDPELSNYESEKFIDYWGRDLILNSNKRELCTFGADGAKGYWLWSLEDRDYCIKI